MSGDIVAYSEFDLSGIRGIAPANLDLDVVAQLLEHAPLVTADDSNVEREINSLVPWMVRFADQHPLFRVALEEPEPPVAKISDFLTLPAFRNLALNRQFFRPLRVTRQIAICPSRGCGRVTGLTVNRSGRDFSERDRNCLTLFTPHVREAMRVNATCHWLRELLQQRNEQVDQLPVAVVLLDGNCQRVELETAAARQIMQRCFPYHERRRRALPDVLHVWANDQRRRSESVGQKDIGAPLALETAAGELKVKFVATRIGVYLLFTLWDPETTITRLRGLGLTRRESEVLQCLCGGGSNREIAARLHLSPGTVRTHVERILAKLGAKTRAAAVSTAQRHLAELN